MLCQREKYYTNILYTIQIIIVVSKVNCSVVVLDKGLMPLERDSIGIQFFVDLENRRSNSCVVSAWKNRCCLQEDTDDDCDTMKVYGGYTVLGPKDAETLILVYPTLYQHDQIGHCAIILEYRCGKRHVKTRLVNIPFDTSINRNENSDLLTYYINDSQISKCNSLDDDSLDNCEHVDCDLKYCGERPFYNNRKCVEALVCEADPESDFPDVIYVPSSNTCRDLNRPLTVADIYAMSTGVGTVTKYPVMDEYKVQLKSNCSTISEKFKFLRDVIYGTLCPVCHIDMTDYKKCCMSALLFILGYIILITCLVVVFICCLHCILKLTLKGKIRDLKIICERFCSKLRPKVSSANERVNVDVRKALIREIMAKDIPIELGDSVVDVCHRIHRKVRKQKRYRGNDIGSQISLCKEEFSEVGYSDTSTNSF